jgi:hypothetical protein
MGDAASCRGHSKHTAKRAELPTVIAVPELNRVRKGARTKAQR